MKAGSVATRNDRINPGVPAKYPAATLRYAPGFHSKNAILHTHFVAACYITGGIISRP